MKLIFLSKTARTIALLAVLVTVSGASINQMVQAQTRSKAQPQLEAIDETERQARYCAGDRDYSVVPKRFQPGDGTVFAYDFMGIEFSPEQQVVIDKMLNDLSAGAEAALERTAKRQDLVNGAIDSFTVANVPKEIDRQRVAALTAANVDRTLPSQQKVEMLNKKFGQYGKFSIAEELLFTPEQVAESKQSELDFQAQVLSILTPEQKKVYLENLAMKRLFGSCDDENLTAQPQKG